MKKLTHETTEASETNQVVTKNPDGSKTWTPQNGDIYQVISVVKGKKRVANYDIWAYANGINMREGCIYLVREGKKYLIQEV